MKKFLAITGLLLLSGCGHGAGDTMSQTLPTTTIKLESPEGNKIAVVAEVADELPEQERGLMFRTHLAAGHGMLFAYPTEQQMTYWMKNTLIPLDIIFFDRHGVYVSSTSMIPCTQDPCVLYPAASPAQYALELPAGFLARVRAGPGWLLEGMQPGKVRENTP